MKRRWFVALGGLCLLASSARSGPPPVYLPPAPGGSCLPAPAPAPPCLPEAPAPAPAPRPETPSTTPSTQPSPQTPPTTPEAPAPTDAPGAAPERGAEGLPSYAPNLFGDAFGGPASVVSVKIPIKVTIPIGGPILQSNGRDPAVFTISSTSPNPAVPVFLTPPGTVVHGQPITENYLASGPLQANSAGKLVYPLLQNSQDAAATLAFAKSTISPRAISLQYVSDVNASGATPIAPQQVNIATSYLYSYLTDNVLVALPSPSNPGFVGNTKISDDNSPLPRDRVICNYDFFSSVPLNMRGVPVHRISPGIEKTFFDQTVSVEVRVPFASTLTSDILADGSSSNTTTELGNVNVTLKALLYGDDRLNVATGVGIALPTADPTRVLSPQGVEVIRVENDTILLVPYVAYLLTPNEYVFFQNWVACAFNTIGNRVLADQDFNGLRKIGRMFDQHQLQVDAQLGYWLIYPGRSDGYLRGLAPFVELHWNSNLSTAPHLTVGDQFVLTPSNPRFNELNLSVGALFQIGNAINLTLGAAFPMLDNSNRTFDYQLGVRCSIFFGPTLRSRSAATTVTSF